MTRNATPAGAAFGVPSHAELRHFERLLADLSARFVNLPAEEVDGAITDALRQIVLLLEVDRCQLIRFRSGSGEVEVTHSWAVDGVPAVRPKAIARNFPWAIGRLRRGEVVVVPSVDDLPREAAVDQASWRQPGVKSCLAAPLRVAGQAQGMIAMACLRHSRSWPEDLVGRVGVLADVFANALAHKRAQEALDAAIVFERTMSDVLAALLTAPRAEQDRVIETGLRRIAVLFGADRATLWQRVGEKAEFTKTHRWLAGGVPPPGDALGPVGLPWISAQLAAGKVVRFARVADLPPEADGDLPRLRAIAVRAAMVVPLTVSGAVIGALSFANATEDRDWSEAVIPRVKLVGEVFAGMLARQAAELREQDAQAQAAHATRVSTLGVIAASLVHELTQPLAASLANAESIVDLLARQPPDLDELRATAADIVVDDRRVVELIGRLRRFLRRGEVERSEFDLREVIDEVLRLVGGEAANKGIEVSLDFPAALPKLQGDRVQLQQVLLNLVLNGMDAVAASRPGSRQVTVRARPSGMGMCVEVADSGHGIDEATLARVFQPFFTTKREGMGLGLAISRTIVAAHGGTLTARSTPGSGTTFRVELPLLPPGEARPPHVARLAPTATVATEASGTVFVVDDDPGMCRALERQLQGAGYCVETFASAQAYLDAAPADGVACIVSDVRMPGLSGLDLQASLGREGRELPMVFMSGHGDVPTTVHAMRAGAVSFLQKPFAKGELLAAVADALARGRELEGARREGAELRGRYDALTPRESEVFALVAAGLLNKVIADRLGAAEATVKIHLGRVMEKMGAASVADLVRMAERLGLSAPESAAG